MLAVLLLMASCGSKKNTSHSQYTPETETTADPLVEAYSSMAASYKPWQDMQASVKLELVQPKKLSISGKATMVYGKSVYLSLRFLGMELGQIYVDSDSIYITSKLQRMAYVEAMSVFTKSFGFTLEDVQSMLLGQAFVPGKGTAGMNTRRDFKLDQGSEAGTWRLIPVDTPSKVDWYFEGSMPDTASGLQAIIDALVVRPASMSPLSATFAKPVDTGAGIAASEVSMSATVSKKALKVNVIWNLQKAEWNKGVTSSAPTIPASYTRLTTTGLINLLKKL